MKKTLPIKLSNGSRMNYGQIINPRAGAPKNFKIAARDHGCHDDKVDDHVGALSGINPSAHPTSDYAAPVHKGVTFEVTMPNGQKATTEGFSRTAFDHQFGGKILTGPTQEKNLARPADKPGQRSRIAPGLVDKSARLPSSLKR